MLHKSPTTSQLLAASKNIKACEISTRYSPTSEWIPCTVTLSLITILFCILSNLVSKLRKICFVFLCRKTAKTVLHYPVYKLIPNICRRFYKILRGRFFSPLLLVFLICACFHCSKQDLGFHLIRRTGHSAHHSKTNMSH